MAPVPSVTILHLSDLHFGRKHRFEREGLGSLLSRVCEDIDERAARDGLRPDLVVLSGDFAEYGKREEFVQASSFVGGLRAHLSLPSRRFVMVPGNHDVNWKKSEAYFADREGDGLPAVEPYFAKFTHYKRFFDAFYAGESGIDFTEDEPWSFFELPDLGVVVAGLNSDFAESHRPEDHHAFLGEEQIRAFAGKLRPYRERGFLRIGVMHHDPFDRRGGAKTDQDQRDLRRWLVPELNLLLHGDIHEETLRYIARDVPALGVGSAAVGVDERGPDISNEYQLLVVKVDGVERHLRAWVSDQKRWVASPRADAEGESGKTFVRADLDAAFALGLRAAPAPVIDLPALVAQYRAAMARNQGAPSVFELLGVGEDGAAGGLDFLRLFVPQEAARDLPRRERWPREPSEAAPPADVEPEARTFFEEHLLADARTVDQLFDQPRLLFIGAPGAGKSALTRWLLLELCVPGERVEGLSADLVPVRIELRRFDEEHRRAGAGFTFFDHFAREQIDRGGPLTAGHLRTLAEQGRVVWLFDGLDEVADPQRRCDMAERIAGLLDAHGECRAVVTSRAAGADVARPILEGAAFQTYALQDFTTQQRDRFLDVWHELVFRRDPATGTARRARMAAAIEATPSLQDLCKSPLLCTMLAYLHREEQLPSKRHRLYQKVLERMAEHWDANKGLPPRPASESFDLDDKLAFLRALAWQMQSEARTAGNVIGRGELEDFAASFCERHWGQPRDAARRRAEALLHQLHARNGVIAYLGAETFGFAHRAFLEHLAAAEAVERFRGRQWEMGDLARLFVEHWQEERWEETLLLLCGGLADDGEAGCARVVRLLQAIGEGRVAEIYGALDDYLVFCIKALGELPQLETGVPGDFARAINDVLVVQIREDRIAQFRFTPAFRRCAGRWPHLRTLVNATVERTSRLYLYETWIAAGGKELRAELTAEALRLEEVSPSLVCLETARFGAWSDEETDLVLEASRHRDEQDRFNIASSMVTAKGAQLHEAARPVELLWELARCARTENLRVRSASMLLRAGKHVDAAKDILVRATASMDEHAAKTATLCLAGQGFGELTLERLASFAKSDDSAFLELVRLGARSPSARSHLNAVLVAIRAAEEPSVLLQAAWITWVHGFPLLFNEEEILERLRRIRRLSVRADEIGWFRHVPGAERLRGRAWLDVLDLKPADISPISHDLRDMTPQQVGPLLFDLWRRVFDYYYWDHSIPLAADILRLRPGTDIELRARQIRDSALQDDAHEQVRLRAAQNFRHTYPPAQRVLEHLATNARDEGVRYTAARLAGNLASLNDLARRTDSDRLRDNIRRELDLYGEIRSLLQVGRLRRARVRMEGRDAGVLEELTRVGNGTRFQYLADYDGPPIAPNMPLGKTYKSEEALLPFFANLLPEGTLYEQTARRLGVKRSDRFGVLLRVGADTMGAVEVLPLEPA